MGTTPGNLAGIIDERQVDRLKIRAFATRQQMGHAAGSDAAARLKSLLAKKSVRMVFAAAPSQNETLATLAATPDIDWSRVTAFHMDEYIGLAADAPQRFGTYLREHIFKLVKPGQVHYIDSSSDAAAECVRYSQLLQAGPIDMVLLGIGENGHIAFNDPPVADFDDREWIKPVELDNACRQQQVNDGCFPTFAAVPTHALTLTIPALMSGAHLFCSVPGPTKRAAVQRTLAGPISTECPSTILRRHSDCMMYVDKDSYGA